MSKSRSFCYTFNNYKNSDIEYLKTLNCVYQIFGLETGDKGTPHLQGYIYFKNPVTLKSVIKLIPGAHIEVAKGTIDQNYDYCSKSGEFLEFGEKPIKGKRSDILVIKQLVKEYQPMKAIIEQATSYQSLKCAELLKKYIDKQRQTKTVVVWLYGPSGCGKSHLINVLFPGAYWCMPNGKWFDGYDGEEAIVIDDIRNSFLSFNSLLNLFDRYPFRVETKGGTRQFISKFIGVTSPVHPKDFYDYLDEDIQQLLRRIEFIVPMHNASEKEKFLFDFQPFSKTTPFW